MPTAKKIDQVKILTDKLGRAKAFFLTDYRGLTHQQLESLRKALKKVEGEFAIAKNTLLKISLKNNRALQQSSGRAMDEDTMQQFEDQLKNPTAALLAYGDEIAPIKALSDFIKIHQLPKIKIGLFTGKLATEADFNKISSLPGRDVLLATLAMRMKGPIYGLHHAMRWNLVKLVVGLNNIKDQKSNLPTGEAGIKNTN